MKAEIISIGDELLIGQIANTNASFIAEKLTEIGVHINWITTIGDNEDQIFESIATVMLSVVLVLSKKKQFLLLLIRQL